MKTRSLATVPARWLTGVIWMLVGVGCLVVPPAALGASPAPAWLVTSMPLPTNFAPGSSYNPSTGVDQYSITVKNIGGAPTTGSPVTVTDTLPAGLTPDPSGGFGFDDVGGGASCTATGQTVTCIDPDTPVIPPGAAVYITVPVDVAASAPASVTDEITAAGGGAAASATTSDRTTIGTSAPGFKIQESAVSITNADGTTDTQAGSHPYQLTTALNLTTTTDQQSNVDPDENVKDLRVSLPPGVIGNPSAIPQCPQQDFVAGQEVSNCPADTQIGVATITSTPLVGAPIVPVYNLAPPGGVPAQFGLQVIATSLIDSTVRTGGDYGITTSANNISEDLPIIGISVALWGVPSDPSHDPQRACPGQDPPTVGGPSCSSSAPPRPFLTLPTSCPGTPLSFGLSADSWQHPGAFVDSSSVSPAITGCDRLSFTPSITVQPDTSLADSPSGLSVDLKVPQNDAVNGLATPDLKKAVVQLPQGVSLSPSTANGLAACTPAEIAISNADAAACPDASKIGSAEIDSPLLPDPLTGGVYVAAQGNNPFGSLLAIYVTAEADGVLVKLAGHVVADPLTGQLTTTFDNNPQLPFTDFKLTFFGGPRGALATPESCGTFSTASDLTPWSGGPDAVSSDPFTVSSGCVSGFSPSFTAGTQNPQAGSYSPFVLSFSRSDTDQDFSGLSVKLPPGMVAKLAGVQECSDAQLAAAAANTGAQEQASPSCPAGSHVGTVTTGAGPGPDSMFLSGSAYLTGPYKGAPYGLAVVVPAVAGPYDLGTVVVRQALYIDPTTAQVTAVSDPFPTILQGIPLRIRRIDVSLDRSGFMLNPTSCNPMSIDGALSSTGGLTYSGNSRLQVGGCSSLGFSPKLKMALSGKGKTRSGDHPTLTATLTQPGGQANIRSARVALPLSMALDPNNSRHVCNYQVAQAVHGGQVGCPASTIVGTATAVTPLLSQPLSGPVYLVQGIRFDAQGQAIHTLPSLLIPLRGQIALDLRAQSSVSGGKLVTTFATIPDAPVSKFVLTITGGPKGLLVITGRGRTICGKAQVSDATLGAQSGKSMSSSIRMSTPCRRATKTKRKPTKHGKK